jgi:pyruvate formate lyase activating enzyme
MSPLSSPVVGAPLESACYGHSLESAADAAGSAGLARRTSDFAVGGLARFSTVDWPGRMVATVFAQGCGWQCRYCHNPHLIPFRGSGSAAGDRPGPSRAPEDAEPESEWRWPEVHAWLRDRRGLLDGVVFSGGEPTLQAGLLRAVAQVRELGFGVGLHTGGPLPAVLAELLPLLDWVGFDLKAPFPGYARVTRRPVGEPARASLAFLFRSGVAHEVRTTWHPRLLSPHDLGLMADHLAALGAREWVLQRFRQEGCADLELCAEPVDAPKLAALRREGLTVRLRG